MALPVTPVPRERRDGQGPDSGPRHTQENAARFLSM